MKMRICLWLLFLLGWTNGTGQDWNLDLDKAELEQHIRFLASDELQGRYTGSPGNRVAARYIAEYLRAQGCKTVEGAEGYFQVIPFESVAPPTNASLKIGETTYELGKDFFLSNGGATSLEGKAVFAEHGWIDEKAGIDHFAGLELQGKLVYVWSGKPGSRDPQEAFAASKLKRKWAAERGAAALIEVYRLPFPWQFLLNYLNRENLTIADPDNTAADLVYGMVNEKSDEPFESMKEGKGVLTKLETSGVQKQSRRSSNVAAVLPGSDPELKQEYMVVSAHYDHVGVGKQGGFPYGQDSIFNGARDNAIGVASLMLTAKALAQAPPKRSVLFLALTAEEQGLIGSSYFVENPLIPLDKIVFNFNTDGAGYNDTSLVAVMGYDRTGVADLIDKGTEAVGLTVVADPAPEQGLFDRSDNVSFARKGIPALSFSPGFRAFDQALMKNYHQVSDEASTLDYDYLYKYCDAFIRTARLIADHPDRPFWVSGDKYEEAGKTLYQRR
ncbi:MAG: M28 family peptidase [Saprospiraceae bacterium]|nr:M28 family peptidase [Saprospiraceae bacterium]